MWELKRQMTSIFIIPADHPLDFVQKLHSRIKLGLEKILLPAICGQNNVPCDLEEKDYSGLRHRDLQGVFDSFKRRWTNMEGWLVWVTSFLMSKSRRLCLSTINKRWFWIKYINQQRCIVAVYMYIYIYKYTHIICSDRERERERERCAWISSCLRFTSI